jgi:hypothetical protein
VRVEGTELCDTLGAGDQAEVERDDVFIDVYNACDLRELGSEAKRRQSRGVPQTHVNGGTFGKAARLSI